MGLDWTLQPQPTGLMRRIKSKVEARFKKICAANPTEESAEEPEEDYDNEEEEYSLSSDEVLFERVGSYSSVHSLRVEWIEAALDYIETKLSSEPSSVSLTNLHANLTRWIEPNYLEYDEMPPQVPLAEDTELLEENIFETFDLLNSLPALAPITAGKPHIAMLISEYAAHLDKNRSHIPVETLRSLGFPDELLGLYIFVNHSDCDGEFTPLDTQRVWMTYETIKPYLSEDMSSWVARYMEVCRTAIKYEDVVELINDFRYRILQNGI